MNKILTLAALGLFAAAAPAAAETTVPGAHFVENWDLSEDGAVSLTEATERRDDIFTTFDADEDGKLSSEEYDAFDEARAADMADMPGHGNGRFNNSMTREASDLNGDGIVTREEFVGGTPDWFAGRDRNGDGVITTADFGPGAN